MILFAMCNGGWELEGAAFGSMTDSTKVNNVEVRAC